MSATSVFDMSYYEILNPLRQAAVRGVLFDLKSQLRLETAIDVGCGPGYFSEFLSTSGFRVTAVDGRSENVQEARRRHQGIEFRTFDAEAPALREFGQFDLVLCFGLLYHLENPFLAIRNLHALTGNLLLVESVIYPGDEPRMDLVDEGSTEDQGLRHIAFYPTEACLIKLMYQAGFLNVYRFAHLPDHPHYQSSGSVPRLRTMLAASHQPLQTNLLEAIAEPMNHLKWRDGNVPQSGFLKKVRRYLEKPQPKNLSTRGKV